MNGVGFEILARTPVPQLSPSYPPPPPWAVSPPHTRSALCFVPIVFCMQAEQFAKEDGTKRPDIILFAKHEE